MNFQFSVYYSQNVRPPVKKILDLFFFFKFNHIIGINYLFTLLVIYHCWNFLLLMNFFPIIILLLIKLKFKSLIKKIILNCIKTLFDYCTCVTEERKTQETRNPLDSFCLIRERSNAGGILIQSNYSQTNDSLVNLFFNLYQYIIA